MSLQPAVLNNIKTYTLNIKTTKSSPQNHLKTAHLHLSRQRMDSPAVCASCAMPTADESNHSAAGRLYPHHTDGYTSLSKAVGHIVLF